MAREKYHYYPFGEQAGSAPATPEAMRFTGHERDPAASAGTTDDLDYMHARYCNPQLGRFLGVDPVMQTRRAQRSPRLWNRYAYVIGNPLSYVDPTGAVLNLASITDEKERESLIGQLSAATGLLLDYDSESGTLQIAGTITDESGKPAGSRTARKDLTDVVGSETTYYGISRNDSATVNMGQQLGRYIYLDFSDIAKIETGKNPAATFNAGMIFLHEMKHLQGLEDPVGAMVKRLPTVSGETVNHMNRIRRELGLPIRGQYRTETDRSGRHYIPFTNGPIYVPGGIK